LVWGYFGVAFLASFIGAMALPEWMLNVSPFHFVPQPQPFEQFELALAPLAALTAIAAALTATGFVSYSRRDVTM
jgi:ABC-2 type transport system permease protein